jgi:hypothetical protein
VKTIGGRVTSYLLDERVKGLNNIGGDFVTPISEPNNIQIIPGLLAKYGESGKLKHTLRIMSTDESESTAAAEIISSDGVFIPVALSDIRLKPKQVIDIPLEGLDLGRANFGLKVQSEGKIVASVFTELSSGNISDFSWSSSAAELEEIGFNLYGLEPFLTIVGDEIDATVVIKTREGKEITKNLSGQEIVNWKIPSNSRLVKVVNRTASSAALSWVSSDGITSLPLNRAAVLESAARPIADIAVIQSRS